MTTYGKNEQWKKVANENIFLKAAIEEKDAEIAALKQELSDIKTEFTIGKHGGEPEVLDAEIVEEPVTGNTCSSIYNNGIWIGPGHDPYGNEY